MQSDTKDRKLFIGGLQQVTVESTLRSYFEKYGNVTDMIIMRDNAGRSRGFGFITFEDQFQLRSVLNSLPHSIDNKEVDVKLAVPKHEQVVDTNRDQLRKLFIGGLNYETTVEGLQRYFGQFGNIVECNIMKNGEGRSRGFGFVTFSDVSALDEAQKSRPHKLDGKVVDSKRAMPKDSGENNMTVNKMFVGGLKEDTTEEMIRQVFSEFGVIEDVDILKDKSNGRPRGFCFVVFTDHDSVDRAVLKKMHDLNGCKVEVRKAVGKDQMGPRGSGPASRGFGGGRDRNFSSGRGRFDRGGGDGFFRGRGGGGRGGYDNNFGGPSNYTGDSNYNDNFGDGGYNNSGGGGRNFGNSGGSFFGNYSGGGDGFDGPGGGNNSRNYGGSGAGHNYSGSGGSGGAAGYGGSSGGRGSFNNFGGSSDGGGGGYQQQNWSGSGYSDNTSNWGGNSGASGGGFENSYNSGYSGGPMKGGSGFASRSQGPYGGGYGSGGNRGSSNSGGGGSGW